MFRQYEPRQTKGEEGEGDDEQGGQHGKRSRTGPAACRFIGQDGLYAYDVGSIIPLQMMRKERNKSEKSEKSKKD